MKISCFDPFVCRLYFSIKENEIKMSGEGLTSGGMIGDALWTDLLRTSPHVRQSYIRVEMHRFVAAPPQRGSDYATVYPTTSLFHSVQKAAPQWQLRSTVEQKSSSGQGKPISESTVSSSAVIACDEAMFNEVWEPAMAALNIVFDTCPVEPLPDSMEERRQQSLEEKEGLNLNRPISSTAFRQERRNSMEHSPRGLQPINRRARASSRATQILERKQELLDEKLNLLKEPSPILKAAGLKPLTPDPPFLSVPDSASKSPAMHARRVQIHTPPRVDPTMDALAPATLSLSLATHFSAADSLLEDTEHDDSVVSIVREGFYMLTSIAAGFHKLRQLEADKRRPGASGEPAQRKVEQANSAANIVDKMVFSLCKLSGLPLRTGALIIFVTLISLASHCSILAWAICGGLAAGQRSPAVR